MAILKNLKCIIADFLFLICGKEAKDKILKDIYRYLKWNRKIGSRKSSIIRLNFLLLSKPEFRSVFYFRTKRHKLLTACSGILLPRAKSVEISGDIDGGLFVSHYHSVICPEKTGKNFRVGPGAAIFGDNGAPTFGDNVYVASNSAVIGNIRIGSNVIIGAGSVVTHDLDANAVYVGNPVRCVKKIDADEKLLDEIM